LKTSSPWNPWLDICAAAIQNANNFGRAKELAYIDGLTGIHNRALF